VEATVNEIDSPKVHIDYKIFKENGLIAAEGYSVLAFMKTSSKKACRPPDFYINSLRKFFKK
jgi:acyl-CoA thioesterase FadM